MYMRSTEFLFSLIWILLNWLHASNSACNFPQNLQTNASNRDWRTKIKSQYRELLVRITFHNNIMRTYSEGDLSNFKDRMCEQDIGNGKFITSQEVHRRSPLTYVCVQFIQRSDNVIQVKTSNVSRTIVGVCEDSGLSLDPWVVIDTAHVLQDGQVCPLVGGFGLTLYDQEYYKPICDAYNDNAWIESECTSGDGLYFNFRYPRCVPNVYMDLKQRTVCVADWQEGRYSFMVIRHDTRPYMWILRYPSDAGDSFVAYLMKELYATTDPYVSGTNMYVRLNTVKNVARPVTSLCVDESEGCSYWDNPCNLGNDSVMSCPRTCGVCNATRPSQCSFEQSWRGSWKDVGHGNRLAARFGRNTMTVHYNRMNQDLHCIRWDEPYTGASDNTTKYGMVVSVFDNGCRPKYSCSRIVHHQHSPVMFFQLSSQKNWPFTSSISGPINCQSFTFENDRDTLKPNRYRSKHYKLLYSKSHDIGTSCNIPIRDVQNFTMVLSDDTRCSVGLHLWNTKRAFTLNTSSCLPAAAGVTDLVPAQHHCVGSSKYFSSDHIMVTRSAGEPFRMFCWVFPRKPRDPFYLVNASHCNENTRKSIKKGHLQPLAVFSRHRDLPTTVAPDMDYSSQSFPFGSIENKIPEDATTDGTNHSDTTETPDNPAAVASPVVVVAAIIFFVIFQIPCMCKKA